MPKRNWVEVDLDGLARTLSRRGKNWIISELIRNSLDEDGVTKVDIILARNPNTRYVTLMVTDDSPDGFRDLAESYTMFSPSYKVDDPRKAGRFNAGEKFVLAFCEEAKITSTTGTIKFDEHGRRRTKMKQDLGTEFLARIKMTGAEEQEMIAFTKTLIIPANVAVTINGDRVLQKSHVLEIRTKLQTEIAFGEGEEKVLRRVKRETLVDVYSLQPRETPMLYELGIPVMEIDGKYHVDINQKVPLTLERDAVPPAYIRAVNTLLVNELYSQIEPAEASQPWVKDATASPDITKHALNRVMDLRFGKQRVIFDPSDTEANRTAVANGYTVISGGSLSREEWANVRKTEVAKPAGQVHPTYRPYTQGGNPAQWIDRQDWSPGMISISSHIMEVALRLLNKPVSVRFERGRMDAQFAANYGDGMFTWNHDKLGRKFFDRPKHDALLNDYIIHELAHEYGGHLTKEFDQAMSRLGGKMVHLALMEPDIFT